MNRQGQHPDLLSDAEKQRRKEKGLQIIMNAAQYATENISRILGEDAENNPDYLSCAGQFQSGTNYFADVPPVQNMVPMIPTRGGISPEQLSYTASQTSTSSSYHNFGINNSHSDFATSTSSSYQTFENSNSHSDLVWPSQPTESQFRSDAIQSPQSPACSSHSQSISPFFPSATHHNMANDDDDSDSDIICLDPPVTDQGNLSNPLISSSMNRMNNNVIDPRTPTSLSDFGSDYAANSPMPQMPQQFAVNPQPISSHTPYLYPNSLSATSYANFSLSGSISSSNQQQQNNIFLKEPSTTTLGEVWKDPIICELLEKYVNWSIDFPYTNGGVKMFCEKVNERAYELGWRNTISKETLYSKASKLRRKLKKQKERQQQENGQLMEGTSNQQHDEGPTQDPNVYHQEEQQTWNFGGTHTYGMVGTIGAEQFLSGNEGRNEEEDEEAPELAPQNELINTPTAVSNAQFGNGADEEPRNEQDALEEENNGEDEWTIGQQLITNQGKIDLNEDFDAAEHIDTTIGVSNARVGEAVEESGNEQDGPEEEFEGDERQMDGQQINEGNEGNNDVGEEVEAAGQIGEMDMEIGHQIEHFDLNAAFEQIDALNNFDDVARNRFKSWPDNFVRDQQKRYAAGLQTARRSKPFKKNKGATNIGWIRKFVRVPPEIGHQQLHHIHPRQLKIDNRIMDVLESEMDFAAFEEQMKSEPRSEFDEEHEEHAYSEDDDEYELVPDENRFKNKNAQQKPGKPKNAPHQKNKVADGGQQKEERRKNRGPLFKYSTQKLLVEVEPMTDLEGLVANLNLRAWPVDSSNLGGTDQPSTSASSSHQSGTAIKSKKRKRKRSSRSPTPEATRQTRQRKFDPGVLEVCRDMLTPKVAKSLGGLPTCKMCGKEFSRAKYPIHMLVGHQIYVSDNKEVLEHLDSLSEHQFNQLGWRCEPCQDQDFIDIQTYLEHCDSKTHKARAGQASKSKKWTLGEWYYGKNNNN